MHPSMWSKMAMVIKENYHLFDGFVILHGSDTMSYTASALSFMLENLDKPVILTGSQLPIGDLRTDAKENLITAIQVAALQKQNTDQPLIQEVCLYFEYKLYRGNRTSKVSSEFFNAFTSPNIPHLAESGVHLKINQDLLIYKQPDSNLKVHTQMSCDVAILHIFPGIQQPVLEAIFNIPNLRGVVMQTYGAGNAPSEPWFINSIDMAIKKGIQVVNVTQCLSGSVDMGKYATSTQLKNIGVISGKDITIEAAITKMMFLLGENTSKNFKSEFERPFCGEIEK